MCRNFTSDVFIISLCSSVNVFLLLLNNVTITEKHASVSILANIFKLNIAQIFLHNIIVDIIIILKYFLLAPFQKKGLGTKLTFFSLFH